MQTCLIMSQRQLLLKTPSSIMFSKEKLELRVGRIPTGSAAYEAEAVELYHVDEAYSSPELGQLSVKATVEVEIAS